MASLEHEFVPDLWVAHFRDRLTAETQRISKARAGATPRAVLIDAAVGVFEEVLSQLALALEDQQSALRAELRSERGSRRAVEAQLAAAQRQLDALRHNQNPRFLRAALSGLGSALRAIGEGAAAAAVTVALMSGPADTTAQQLAFACDALNVVVEQGGGYSTAGDQSSDAPVDQPDVPRSNSQDREDDEEFDDLDEFVDDPWLQAQDNEGRYVLPGVDDFVAGESWRDAGFLPDDAADWLTHGFDLAAALRWSRYGLSPTVAEVWGSEGFDADEAVDWIDADLDVVDAKDWGAEGFEPEEVWSWALYEINAGDAAQWAELGYDAEDAYEMIRQGRTLQQVEARMHGPHAGDLQE